MPNGFRRVLGTAALLAATAAPSVPAQAQAPAPAGPATTPQAKAAAQSAAAQAALIAHLNAAGFAQLDRRVATIAAITSRAQAERRQAEVRRTVEELVGGVPDLLTAIHPRRVTLVNAATPMGLPARDREVRAALASAFAADASLRTPDRIRLARRGFGDPVPID